LGPILRVSRQRRRRQCGKLLPTCLSRKRPFQSYAIAYGTEYYYDETFDGVEPGGLPGSVQASPSASLFRPAVRDHTLFAEILASDHATEAWAESRRLVHVLLASVAVGVEILCSGAGLGPGDIDRTASQEQRYTHSHDVFIEDTSQWSTNARVSELKAVLLKGRRERAWVAMMTRCSKSVMSYALIVVVI
jgi:hypothetical protein